MDETEDRDRSLRMVDLMSTTFNTWMLMTYGALEPPAGHLEPPQWYAIVFGMLDCIGQAFEADQKTTKTAMNAILGEARAALCIQAGHQPALSQWVMEGGQAAHACLTDNDPAAIYAALARQYLIHPAAHASTARAASQPATSAKRSLWQRWRR